MHQGMYCALVPALMSSQLYLFDQHCAKTTILRFWVDRDGLNDQRIKRLSALCLELIGHAEYESDQLIRMLCEHDKHRIDIREQRLVLLNKRRFGNWPLQKVVAKTGRRKPVNRLQISYRIGLVELPQADT